MTDTEKIGIGLFLLCLLWPQTPAGAVTVNVGTPTSYGPPAPADSAPIAPAPSSGSSAVSTLPAPDSGDPCDPNSIVYNPYDCDSNYPDYGLLCGQGFETNYEECPYYNG